MLQKLRIKFILLAMALMIFVLAVIMGTINLLNYRHVLDSADQTLEILLEGDGRFPEKFNSGKKHFDPKMSPELPFETRFFTVLLAEDGTVLLADTGKIAAVTPETAVEYAAEALVSKDAKGFVGDYRYAVKELAGENLMNGKWNLPGSSEPEPDGDTGPAVSNVSPMSNNVNLIGNNAGSEDKNAVTAGDNADPTGSNVSPMSNNVSPSDKNELGLARMIVFVDCGRQLSAAKTFLFTSIEISLAGFLAVSMLLYILSARIVKPISDSYEKQRQFITNASHDLKTPITIIDADTDILEMEQGENEWIRDIRNQTERLTELIQELVLLSRMEEKENHFQMIDFPVSDVIEETVQPFEALATNQGKTFTAQIQPMLSYCGDAQAIRRLVTILLDNAMKYSDEKGTVSISFEKADSGLKLAVNNTCDFIAEEDIKHMFERFYRGDKSRNSETGGYGIGLSVAKAIVEAHKGAISATTKDGHGLTVTATFPIK